LNELTEEFEARMRRRQEDHDAIQDEMAGHGFSRQSRLGRKRDEVAERRNGRSASGMSGFTSQLQMLLATDPVYRAAYERTWDALTTAEKKADAEIVALEAALLRAEQDLQDLKDRAAVLPDGRAIFRKSDGTVVDEFGNDVTLLAQQVEWTGLEPTWEEFQGQQRQVEKVSDNLREWRHYQVDTLGRARDRMTDEDNPPSKRELDKIMKDIENTKPSSSSAAKPTEAVVVDNNAARLPSGPLPSV